MPHQIRSLGGLLAAMLLSIAPAQSQGREITVFNRGNEAIFALQIGHVQAQDWSPDLLPFAGVVDVSEGVTVSIAVGAQCVYDIRATYRDGDTVSLKNVDLCAAASLTFEH